MLDRYPGAKGAEGVWQRIISEMPPHRVYVEAFAGSAVIARRKKAAASTILVDADPVVREMWKSSRAEHGGARGAKFVRDDARDFLKRFFWGNRHEAEQFLLLNEGAPLAGPKSDVLVYCDPPYLMETRSCQRPLYNCELVTDQEHKQLLDVLKRIPAMVMISGYWSTLYERELTGWRTIQIPTIKRNGERATEWVWCNFPEPVQLHDYRFLGEGYRERERIKKKMRRWTAKLRAMPGVERSALFWAMSMIQDAPPESAIPTSTVQGS
jgi:DNA adenine methylase